MKLLPRSLHGLTVTFLVLFLAVTTIAGFGTFHAARTAINQLVDRRIALESYEIAPKDAAVSREDLRRRIQELTGRRDTADLGILLTDGQGRAIAGNTRLSRAIPVGFSSLDKADSIEGLSAGRVFMRPISRGMRLAVFAETEPFDDYVSARRLIYIAGFGAIILVVLAGLLTFRSLVGRRIAQVRQTAESIIEGDLSRRVPVSGDGGEFDQQAAAFNRMLDRIGVLVGEVRNVSNDIAHEMRTPLARLRNALAVLELDAEAEPVHARLQVAREQADELLAMFSAMLRIAEIDSGSRRSGFAPLDVSELVAEVVEMVQPLADERWQSIALARADAPLHGDRQLLLQLVANLTENAVRHTPEGTAIRIAVARDDHAVKLTITDDGPGIPADQRAVVMRRFGRAGRSGETAGHGLGLPLADAIARLHHGSLRLENAEPGLRIVVTLPA
ncbi:HAMP domain-containing sensor histidine kinase [Novosphingobium sp. Leaf2]|uniref:HAMP domain-containing sensor histidine kinase n=1 Tax=Novosphingobium sp. Leaf2 TaxID=1735670 RepID=UPI000701DDD1|nr:ATP-binding protein [Novosphingobium sp. Leaf2]KQM21081.1 histidine kinase [Novosphingobium sp. Leaf2]